MEEDNTGQKPRKPSTFTLVRVIKDEEGGVKLQALKQGATDKALMEVAVGIGEGSYAIVNIRREFAVKTKTQTVVE